jgi:hypothetical protein
LAFIAVSSRFMVSCGPKLLRIVVSPSAAIAPSLKAPAVVIPAKS